ncbi:MAG: hypothetical protein ACNA8W_03710 [Bradymonadaceae bacterium]
MAIRLPHWFFLCALLLPLANCTCADEDDYIWTFYEPFEEEDVYVGVDTPAPMWPDIVEEDVDRPLEDILQTPDAEEEEILDPREWEEGEWTTETIDEEFAFSHALNERTSLVVDSRGTLWLGYHACDDRQCSSPRLVVGRKPIDGEWTYETIQNHRGLFGLQVIRSEEPIAVYVDDRDQSFKVAMRKGPNHWEIQRIDVGRAGLYDGFDVTNDRTRFYLSFASSESTSVDFFVYNVAANQPYWRRLPSLPQAYSAAMERGLGADNSFSLYLVHRQSRFGSYGVAHYNLGQQRWDERVYFDHSDTVSSFVVRRNDQLCLSHERGGNLAVSCGNMDDLSRETTLFREPISGYSSMIEGRDGSLFVAFHGRENTSMRVARGDARRGWAVETAFQGSSYGISTAINHHDQLAMAFYTCPGSLCSLRVLQKTYD